MTRTCPFCTQGVVSECRGTLFGVCNSCGLFINVQMSREEIKDANKNHLLSTCQDTPPGRRRMAAARTEQFPIINKYYKAGRVYDVGAASGFFMKVAIENGWIAEGNDISERAITWGKANLGIDIDYGFFEELPIPKNSYDLVVMWNSLEHTFDPKKTLLTARDILKTGGGIFIKVPNKKTPEDLNKFYETGHLFEFTNECLSKHLRDLGFQKVYENPYQANSNSGFVETTYLYKKI